MTDVQATSKFYYPEAAATACKLSYQTFQLLAGQVDTPALSSLRVTLMIYSTCTIST